MDIFRILSRGASVAKSKGVSSDFALPSELQAKSEKKKVGQLQEEAEKETDFFHTKKHTVPRKLTVIDAEQGSEDSVDEWVEVEGGETSKPSKIVSEADARVTRKINKINVTGDDIPLPVGSFEDLRGRYKLDNNVLDNLTLAGFSEPTPIQSEAIPVTLEGRDLIGCAPTGSGKTIAFVIPLIQNLLRTYPGIKNFGIRGLIISPTNELADQIFQELELIAKKSKLTVGILSKQLSSKINNKIINPNKFDILVSTPLRLIDCIKNETMELSKVEEVVIDEADKLFDHGFVEQTDSILADCTNVKIRKSLFSATIPSGVEEMAHSIMNDPIRIIVGHKEAASSSIDQKLVFTGSEEGKLLAIRQMIQQGEFIPPVIIFLQSITRAKALYHELMYDKLNVDVIHAERTQKQRQEAIRRFRNGDIWVLITTDVLSRGVDFKGVNLVINYDVPQSAQAYVHRIGRTGRGGRRGKAVTLFTKEDNIAILPILNVMKQSGCSNGYSDWMENMHKLTKKDKQNIKRHEIKRKKISTVPKIVRHKSNQKQRMIEASKRRKYLKEIVD